VDTTRDLIPRDQNREPNAGTKPGNRHTEDTEVTEVTGRAGGKARITLFIKLFPKTPDPSVSPVTAVFWFPGLTRV